MRILVKKNMNPINYRLGNMAKYHFSKIGTTPQPMNPVTQFFARMFV